MNLINTSRKILFHMTRQFAAMLAIAALIPFLVFFGCGQHNSDEPDSPNKRLPVFVGIPPLAFLAEQIGGEHVEVGVLVQPGQDPHTFEPSPQQVLALSKAKLFFAIGMPFEKTLLDKITEGNRRLVVIDAAYGVPLRGIHGGCACGHDHAAHDHADHEHADHQNPADHHDAVADHDHAEHASEAHEHDAHHEDAEHETEHAGEPDPHVWLSPILLKQIAKNIAEELQQADPKNAQDYSKNLEALVKRIDATHEKIAQTLKPYESRAIYVFHPGFGYFADAFGLKQVAVEVDGHSPSPKEMQHWIETARQDHVAVIFVQPQSPRQSAQAIAEAIGGQVVTIDGLAKDVLLDMEDIATKIDAALKGHE
jgi:zinc transport system substrate-binding protein